MTSLLTGNMLGMNSVIALLTDSMLGMNYKTSLLTDSMLGMNSMTSLLTDNMFGDFILISRLLPILPILCVCETTRLTHSRYGNIKPIWATKVLMPK